MTNTSGLSYSGQIFATTELRLGPPCAWAGWNENSKTQSNNMAKIRRMGFLLKENDGRILP
jgi:hypothetical protein